MKDQTAHQQVTQAISDGWMAGGSFFGSILSGFLVGFLADRWLGTEPWLVVAGILLGAYSGFVRMWHYAKEQEQRDRQRRGTARP